MDFEELVQKAEDLANEVVIGCDAVRAERLGLDNRAAFKLYVDKARTFIACAQSDVRTLNYYGGFEYIEPENITRVSGWTFYSRDSDRVDSCLDRLDWE